MLLSGRFKVKTGYLTAFVLLLGSYILIFATLQKFLRQTIQIEHTDLIINNLETLSSYTNEAESAARGYALLNDSDYLQMFYATTQKIDLLLKNIDSVTSDNYRQHQSSRTLNTMIQEKLGRIYKAILLFKQSGYVLSDDVKKESEVGKRLMLDIRNIIRKMESEERGFLRDRKEKLQSVSNSIKIVTITSLVLAILLSVYSFITYSKESTAKGKADQQANLYRSQLENKVRELQTANSELHELRSLEKFTATGRIARTIAHEIRNPLTNMVLAAEQIKTDKGVSQESQMLLDMINRNGIRINQMISELLASTKFAQLQYSTIDISALLDESVELAKDRIELKHIQVIKNYTPPPCIVVADIDKMKIALLNIVVNAVEAMEKEGGVLSLETSVVNSKCKIIVRDNGCGMTEETMQKLFDPYFTNKAGGNGLGLTNSQNIILNHKGSVSVVSHPGQGSTFTIILNTD